MPKWLARRGSLVLVLAMWELLARSGFVNPRLFPSLLIIGQELVDLFTTGVIWDHLGATLIRVVAGYGAAAVVGVLLGFALARSALAERFVEPLFSASYPMPRIAVYPILVLAFGLGHAAKASLVFLECLYPIAITTYAGVRSLDPIRAWAAQNMGADARQVLLKVVVPEAAPFVFAGLRIALPIALAVVVISEMIGATEGIGYLVAYAAASLSRAQVFAGVLVIGLVGTMLDLALSTVRDRLVFWDRHEIRVL